MTDTSITLAAMTAEAAQQFSGAASLLLAAFCFILAIVVICLPFYVAGIYGALRRMERQQKAIIEELRAIRTGQ